MSMQFTKLFSSITESTIWVAPDAHRICWITMLAMADSLGRVWGSVPGLANRARISVDDARSALTSFLSPDADSRTKDNEGRRIEEIDGGWRLLNHAKYRAIRDEEAIREAKRKYINTRREIERGDGVDNVDRSRPKATAVDRGRHIAEAEAEAEEEATTPKAKTKTARARSPSRPDGVSDVTWSDWLTLRKAKRAPVTDTVVLEAAKEADKAGLSLEAFLRVWCARGSQGLMAEWLKPTERGKPQEKLSKWIKGTSLDPDFKGYQDDTGGIYGNATALR